MEKQSTIKQSIIGMPQLPVKAIRKELFRRYSDCQTLWNSLVKEYYPRRSPEEVKIIFLRYITEKTKEKEEPMYLNQTSLTVKYSNPYPVEEWNGDDEDCDDYNEEEGNNPMNNDIQDQRNHLSNRVYQITGKHETTLRVAFHLNDDEAPETFDELVKRFKEGKVQFEQNLKTDRKFSYFPDLMRYVEWRDPAVPADQAGFDAAWAKVQAMRTNVMDDVSILEPKEALASVRAYETATFTS